MQHKQKKCGLAALLNFKVHLMMLLLGGCSLAFAYHAKPYVPRAANLLSLSAHDFSVMSGGDFSALFK